MTAQESGWWRESAPDLLCECGHSRSEHRHDLAASSPCYRFPCECSRFRLAARSWREHRTVVEPAEE